MARRTGETKQSHDSHVTLTHLLMYHTKGWCVCTWEPLAEQFDADDGLGRGCLHSPVQAGLAIIVLSMDINLGERAGRKVASNNIHNLITSKRLIGCVE